MKHVVNLLKNFMTTFLAFIMAFIPFSGGKEAKTEENLEKYSKELEKIHKEVKALARKFPVPAI